MKGYSFWLRPNSSFWWSLVQFCYSIMSDSLQSHGLQHTSLPCSSPTPGACLHSRPLSQWCHPTISSSVIPFSSCLQSFPASGSFTMSQFFTSDGQNIGASASASVLPVSIQGWCTFQDWFPSRLTGFKWPKRKFESMARVRAGIINWPGKRIPSSNIMNKQKRTELSFF